jgi:hypothetical protein
MKYASKSPINHTFFKSRETFINVPGTEGTIICASRRIRRHLAWRVYQFDAVSMYSNGSVVTSTNFLYTFNKYFHIWKTFRSFAMSNIYTNVRTI